MVGFKTEVLAHLSPPCRFFEVIYGERPICTPLDFIPAGSSYGLAEKVFSVKSEEWEYEKEWRCLFGFQQLGGSEYLGFPASAVERVILGASISRDAEILLKNACRAGGLLEESMKIDRAQLSPRNFSVAINATTWRD